MSGNPNLGSVPGKEDGRDDEDEYRLRSYAYAFYNLGGGKFSDWKVGTAYGLEFQRITLPDGFIFAEDIPTGVGNVKPVKQLTFRFDQNGSFSGDQTVDISRCRVDSNGNLTNPETVGTASSEEMQ